MGINRALVRRDLQLYYGRNYCRRIPTPSENLLKNCFDNDQRAWETTGDDINHSFWWIAALQTKLTTQDMRASTTINHLVTCIFRNSRAAKVRSMDTVVLASAQLMADDLRAFNRVEKFILEQIEGRSTAALKTKAASKRSRKAMRRKTRRKKTAPRSKARRLRKTTSRKRRAA